MPPRGHFKQFVIIPALTLDVTDSHVQWVLAWAFPSMAATKLPGSQQ
jgi:hypothetical protein